MIVQFKVKPSVKIGDRFECIELIRDGGGPCSTSDGSEGYPEFDVGQQVEVVRADTPIGDYYWPISVVTPSGVRGVRVDHYDEKKLRKYFRRIR